MQFDIIGPSINGALGVNHKTCEIKNVEFDYETNLVRVTFKSGTITMSDYWPMSQIKPLVFSSDINVLKEELATSH
jgi:hypothetical protein